MKSATIYAVGLGPGSSALMTAEAVSLTRK